MAIISASRKTDIPTYYGKWLINRLNEGMVITRNAYNNKLSKIVFNKQDIDCIVLWTKNPIPFLPYLDDLKGYTYYFQYTLTGYDKDFEANLPDKERLIQAFKDLHDRGNGHIVWRYDPIAFTNIYTPEWHLLAFDHIANSLRGYTDRCVISFVDLYSHMDKNIKAPIAENSIETIVSFCKKLSDIALENGMTIQTCAEPIILADCGITRGKCIDGDYIEKISGKQILLGKDKGQRDACGCIESIDIGTYNSCHNGCKYCYANKNAELVRTCFNRYDENSPILCDTIFDGETYTEKHLKSFACERQLSFFDDYNLT